MFEEPIYFYLTQFFQVLASPIGMLAACALILFIFASLKFHRAREFLLALLLYSATFGFGNLDASMMTEQYNFPFPLNILAQYARTITVSLAFCLVFSSASTQRGWRARILSGGAIMFFLLNIWMSYRLALEPNSVPRAVVSAIAACIFVYTLVIGAGRRLQTTEDGYELLKILAIFAVLFVLGNLYLFVRNRAAFSSNILRLSGTTNNPQPMGQITALLIPTITVLLFRTQYSKFWRLVLLATAGFLATFLLWSGSRSGFLTCLVGLALLFRMRLGRLAIAAIALGAALLFATYLFPDSLLHVDRFLNTTNTRAGQWALLIENIRDNPIIGRGFGGYGYQESFFLSTWAAYGIFGEIAVAFGVWFIGTALVRIYRHRHNLGEHSILVDICLANFGMLATTSIFECSLLGSLNHCTLFLYLNLALLAFLRDATDYPEMALGIVEDPAFPVKDAEPSLAMAAPSGA